MLQKRFKKSESEFLAEEIHLKSQNLRKTEAFEELERQRASALKDLYTDTAQPFTIRKSTV